MKSHFLTGTWGNLQSAETEEVTWMSDKMYLPLINFVQITRINFLGFPCLDYWSCIETQIQKHISVKYFSKFSSIQISKLTIQQ